MNKKEERQDVKFQIKGIDLVSINLDRSTNPKKGLVTFKFNINVEIKIDNDKSLVISIVSVEITDLESEEKYGSIKVNCIFGIENLNSFINKTTGKVILPKQFVTVINSISISTVRGVMFSQFRGTYLHGAVLPIIDPNFLEEQVSK